MNKEVLNSLAAKLEGLELSDDEQKTLDAVISRAAAADVGVQGFGWDGGTVGLSPMGLKLGAGIGRFGGSPMEMGGPMEMGKPEMRGFNPTER